MRAKKFLDLARVGGGAAWRHGGEQHRR